MWRIRCQRQRARRPGAGGSIDEGVRRRCEALHGLRRIAGGQALPDAHLLGELPAGGVAREGDSRWRCRSRATRPPSRDKPGFKRRRMHDGFAVKEADVIPAEVQVAVQFESRQATHMGRVVSMAPRYADRHGEVVPIQVLVHLDFAFRDFLRQERATRRSPCRQAEAYEQRDCQNALHATGTVCHGSRASRRYPAARALGRRMRQLERRRAGVPPMKPLLRESWPHTKASPIGPLG